jgi:hypothetical protein
MAPHGNREGVIGVIISLTASRSVYETEFVLCCVGSSQERAVDRFALSHRERAAQMCSAEGGVRGIGLLREQNPSPITVRFGIAAALSLWERATLSATALAALATQKLVTQ